MRKNCHYPFTNSDVPLIRLIQIVKTISLKIKRKQSHHKKSSRGGGE